MKIVNKLKKLGYTVEPWSSWEGDKGKFKFCKGNGHLVRITKHQQQNH